MLAQLGDSAAREPRRRPAGLLHRLLRRAAAVLPRRQHRRPRRQRHGQRPCHERRPGRLPLLRVHPGGGRRDVAWSPGSPRRMGAAARAAGVEVATGDTKVVEAGHGDGIYLNTAGIGLIPAGVDMRPQRVVPGDVVIVSGDDRRARRGDHERARGTGVRRRRSRATARRSAASSRRCSPSPPTCTCCATPPAAAWPPPSTRSRRPPAPVCVIQERDVPVPAAGGQRLRHPRPRPDVRRQRGQAGRLRPPRARRRGARRDAGASAGRRCGGDRRGASRHTPAWSWPVPRSAAPAWSICRWGSSCRGSADGKRDGGCRGAAAARDARRACHGGRAATAVPRMAHTDRLPARQCSSRLLTSTL